MSDRNMYFTVAVQPLYGYLSVKFLLYAFAQVILALSVCKLQAMVTKLLKESENTSAANRSHLGNCEKLFLENEELHISSSSENRVLDQQRHKPLLATTFLSVRNPTPSMPPRSNHSTTAVLTNDFARHEQ
ncbi:hypothetical protein EVAR_76062_1 [Eumeta japonica]|uniref:Uncharacterized protein n=1 Tax=Eumeta variegata TaxID=151549 RepID=A0A4C1W6P0_EUMVA|nr:hypothetical protein EVAR_76062_1 [Eumeta japonica]